MTIPPDAADRFTSLFWPHLDAAGEACAIIEDFAPEDRQPDGPIDVPGLTAAQRLYLFHLAMQMAERNRAAQGLADDLLLRLAA